MAGSMARDKQSTPAEERWEVEYSRFLTCIRPPSRHPPSLSPLSRKLFRRTWLSFSPTPAATLSLFSDPSLHGTVLAVSFRGRILEKHYVSNLHFSWPQLSCRPDVPERGGQAVFVSYKDGSSEMELQKFGISQGLSSAFLEPGVSSATTSLSFETGTHKFGIRFSTYGDVREFATVLEDGFSAKQDSGDLMITRSSQSEAKDMLSEETPSGASQHILETRPISALPPEMLHLTREEVQSHSTDTAAIDASEGYVPEMPPSFTSLLTNCSEMAQGGTPASTPVAFQEADLKSLIARCMQDTSFLDILSKVEDMIAEVGDATAIHQFL